jgi:small subunit ribosomal protein S20
MAEPAKPKLPKGRHASQIKRQRQTLKRTRRNSLLRSDVRTYITKVREAVSKKDAKLAQETLLAAVRKINKAVSKGIFHANNGSRKISRLAKLVGGLGK